MAKKLQDMTEPEIKHLMETCARTLQDIIRQMTGSQKSKFVLLVFDDPKISQYISSCQREDVIPALREAAKVLEQGRDLAEALMFKINCSQCRAMIEAPSRKTVLVTASQSCWFKDSQGKWYCSKICVDRMILKSVSEFRNMPNVSC